VLLTLRKDKTLVKKSETSETKISSKNTIEVPDIEEVTKRLDDSLHSLAERLRFDYGQYLESVVWNDTNLEELFSSSPSAKDQLVRRMQIKFLASVFERDDTEGNSKFTWVTAGHSAAAGHGNLFNQSYTAMLEDTVKDVFSSVGIDFGAKNYAMGGMRSYPELALCMESVYGEDIDVLSWDFGMTDGSNYDAITLWGHRTKLLSTQPVLFGMTFDDRYRVQHFHDLERIGLGTVTLNNFHNILNILPDSLKLNDTQSIPPALRYYLCDGHVEPHKEPCVSYKFNTEQFCPNVQGQVSWHPGWKHHMLQGRLIGFYLLQRLRDAMIAFLPTSLSRLEEQNETYLQTTRPSISSSFLQYLRNHEQQEKDYYFVNFTSLPKLSTFSSLTAPQIIYSFFHSPSFCHTGLLPSHIRYNNILYPPLSSSPTNHSYYLGISRSSLTSSFDDQTTDIQLIHDPGTVKCVNVTLEQDFKDYFLIGLSNISHLTLPNKYEMKAYRPQKSEVTIMICHVQCDWNICPSDYITVKNILPDGNETSPNVTVHINNQKVVNVTEVNHICFLLENENSGINWTFDPKVKLRMKFEIHVEKFLYISSIIILFGHVRKDVF